MASVARAVYGCFVSWSAVNTGLLTFDASLFNGTDVFGVSPLDATFTGLYDDISADVERATIGRGRTTNLETMLAGEASIDIRDPSGIFNPGNEAGPLFGELEDRLHPVMIVGDDEPLFYGWIRRFVWEPQGRRGMTQAECVDLFYWLARVRPIIASTGVTTVGAAIALILDAAELLDPAMRDLDAGQTIPDFSADGSKTALELIEDLLEADRGVFFIAGNGAATFRDRLARLTSSSAATLDNTVQALDPGVDFDVAANRVIVVRTQTGYVATAEDATAVARNGPNDYRIETSYLATDSDADSLAAWILPLVVDPQPAIYSLRLDNRTAAQLAQILGREIGDRVTVPTSYVDSAEFHLDRIEHTIDTQPLYRHTCSWLLSRASTISPIVFDVSTFDGGGVFV